MNNMAVAEHDVVLSSRVRLARNYRDVHFLPTMTKEMAEENINRAVNAVGNSDYRLIRMRELSEAQRQDLVEHHVISYDLLKYTDRSATLLSQDETVSIMVNEEDHLRIQGLLPGLQLESAAEMAFHADDLLGQCGRYAFDAQWGYLTSCPTNTGTGMRASTLLHLPALTASGQINQVVQAIAKLGMTVRGLYGEGSDAVGCMYQLSNQVTLGRSEDDIIRSLVAATMQLAGNERSVREQMIMDDAVLVADKLMRSVGIAKTARIMTLTEFMTRMSDLRCASVLGFIDFSLSDIDCLTKDLQNGSLSKSIDQGIDARKVDLLRADRLRSALRNI